MKTQFFHASDADRKWFIVDAENQTVGRLASQVASVLRGKHKTTFTPNTDQGDFVIVINASRIKLSGAKAQSKSYFRYSGYPGGGKSETFEQLLKKRPERIVEYAVKGMLPKNKLGRQIFKKLKVYADAEHSHQAQKPEVLEIKK